MSSFDPHSNRYDLTIFIIALAVIASVFLVTLSVTNSTKTKVDALVIREAMEQKADLHEVRCLLNPTIAACDTVSLVKELRVDPRFAPRQMPELIQP